MNGCGVPGERMETGTGETVSKELSLGNCKLTLAQANRQAMDSAQLQNVAEMLNIRRLVWTKDEDIININKTVWQIT